MQQVFYNIAPTTNYFEWPRGLAPEAKEIALQTLEIWNSYIIRLPSWHPLWPVWPDFSKFHHFGQNFKSLEKL